MYSWSGTNDDFAAWVGDYPWATLISQTTSGLVVSHAPVLPEQSPNGVALVGHLALDDALVHELGSCDVVVVLQGPHGYISPTWYVGGPYVPTWNFVVAHFHGRPAVLDEATTYDVLDRTVEHFEQQRPAPFHLGEVDEYARRIAPYVAGFRLVPERLVVKEKLSQDKPAEDWAGVVSGLENPDDVHANAGLAETMRRHKDAQ